MELSFDAVSVNEAFSRTAVAMFMAQLDPTLEQIDDVKTAVSEAVTNAIIHGYNEDEPEKQVKMKCMYDENRILTIKIIDEGIGIKNIDKAMQPLYTSKPQMERSGMGFSFMQAFMDSLVVESECGRGTTVTMTKKL
ncbi:MAG: anti-sigma F factor [Lachnospiraceae bacterium]|uniref:anti-sigma F factor n=1 Tax=Agathobacter sp. TaxID=2021311 RepID=UPI00280620A5|nr:anti-sigma F factor [uncultured Agathobacter sp.]MDD6139477.1 anti-sigma F factor [Lachnospiraceae bacterium]MDY6156615.1 anti-sigma F factor [Agathobacter sp.]MEE1033597.1 anti-sigma F factor [Agathobacter sp.]